MGEIFGSYRLSATNINCHPQWVTFWAPITCAKSSTCMYCYPVILLCLHSATTRQPYTKVIIPMTIRKLQELQKKWPRKVNNLTYSPHGISVLFRLNWFHGSSKDEYIHCFMTFSWLLLFKPVRSWVQTTFSNWKLFSSWRSPLNC